jgi:hypothetical protein
VTFKVLIRAAELETVKKLGGKVLGEKAARAALAE